MEKEMASAPQPGMMPPPGGMPAPVVLPPGMMPSPFMSAGPPSNPDCPPGLEYLSAVDQLLVQQKIELLEMITGFETNNKYELKNSLGQRVYFAAEQSNVCARMCCGAIRPFTIKLADNSSRVVMELRRPLRCQACCYPCCLQRLEVLSGVGQLIGVIKQNWTLCKPQFTIYNESDEPVLQLRGPCITCRCCTDVNFKVFPINSEQEIGAVSKQWSGMLKEMYTDADNFCVKFPLDLDVKMKAVLVACAFLIDFMFFEDKQKNRH